MSLSNDFEWDLERPERTVEFPHVYDVQKAKKIIVANPKPVQVIEMSKHGSSFKEYLGGVKLKGDADWSKVDAELPIIFGQTKADGRFPIDGRHRLAKAIDEGRDHINGIILSEEETAEIRVV